MKAFACFVGSVAMLAAVLGHVSHADGDTFDSAPAPVFGIRLPPGYRDWGVISVAHEGGHYSDLRVVLGNGIAIKAYRTGKLPFPDGTMIARLAWSYAPSAENNKVFGRAQSFVAGVPINVQLSVKNSKTWAATGGWGFAQFKNSHPADAAVIKTCAPCHAPAKANDFVFTRYAPSP
jgi:hypothetical protein